MMDEEDEFGMSKMTRDADPMEHEAKSAVKDHPDFQFLDVDEIHVAMMSEDKAAVPLWMMHIPVEKDLRRWTIVEIQIRPDRSWEVIKELIATICIGKGLVMTEEHINSMLFRKKVTRESITHGVSNSSTYLNVYVRIGVSPSKLRVVDICTLVLDENNLLGAIVLTKRYALWETEDPNQSHKYALDQLLGALQSTLLSQRLSLSDLYMSTFENSMDTVENAELDEGYVADVKRAFSRYNAVLVSPIVHMREVCIPLESYAYDQEYACAQMIGLLEPFFQKYGIKLTVEASSKSDVVKDDTNVLVEDADALTISEDNLMSRKEYAPSLDEHKHTLEENLPLNDQTQLSNTCKIYGEVISELVQNLWKACKEDCKVRLNAKIEEKHRQVSTRVEAVQSLRTRAIRAIMESNLIYRTMVPVFAQTTVAPLKDFVNVIQTTSFGMQVVYVELNASKHLKGITIAMGLEVDLLYQLLFELFLMHQKETNPSTITLSPLQQLDTEKNPAELKKILGSEEEETKKAIC
ncbi:uncharacterized protein CCR75_006640 [Bremia lactucae]|uniref:Uncharacterized protein n=1 Tax=Bremia lactucae TaxID=4779 RepID=A0A976IAX8_BRELC|nr:hypothetical protein CCR75_006640 [Bremia lactucae]